MRLAESGLPLHQRQYAVISYLQKKGFARVKELAVEFDVDAMTIRRDLNQLQELGFLNRIHGGCRLSERGVFDCAFTERARQHAAAKANIGEYAASLVKPGQVVLIDSGTTPLAVARSLAKRQIPNVTVVTSVLAVLWELYDALHMRVIALGGDLQRETGQLYGPLTENMLSGMIIDIAFLGADGIDIERGFATTTPEAARLAGKMAESAREWYIVADSSKIGAFAPYVYAPFKKSTLLTDTIPSMHKDVLHKAGLLWYEADAQRRKE
jgi:DeoR/GlpR family transcriptional regulator of sugar metabolism